MELTVGCGAVIVGLGSKPDGGVCNPESLSFPFKLGASLLVPATRDVFEPPNQPRNTGVALAEVDADADASGLDGIAIGDASLSGCDLTGGELGIILSVWGGWLLVGVVLLLI